ncbi:hypothetical protein A3A39_01055 [Candidatus Kaiserbacteria bacterium RIFCSPLOWO2_01_FULL_54_13]|uniref:Uncharacterized protein n=1 Tax=Candidatus Kaiserbacteria bacterium RIFCSPLOWO2_01_FULL_54_13 TaxID=1798512 RepID=A0A1F6F275_9BACT|nr:MAG: hypothetical protein A3A39_01055 [Candidatus Kaiserbacteria bacterium RIFCSPLOWO2_01_FULL_54_13]
MSKQQFKLGDAIAKLAKVLHIPHCPGCEQRRLILNEIQKVGVRETVRRLRAVGFRFSMKGTDKRRSVEDIVKKMEDCCDE